MTIHAWERRLLAGSLVFFSTFPTFYTFSSLPAQADIVDNQHLRAHRFLDAKQADQATTILQTAIKMSTLKTGATSRQTRCLIFDLADAYSRQKNYLAAEPLLEKLTTTQNKSDSTLTTARYLLAYATNEQNLNDESAKSTYMKVLSLLKTEDVHNPDVAAVLAEAHIGLASLLFDSNSRENAEYELHAAMKITDSPSTDALRNARRKAAENLSTLLMLTGRSAEASAVKRQLVSSELSSSPEIKSESVIAPESRMSSILADDTSRVASPITGRFQDRMVSGIEQLANEFLEDDERAEETPKVTIPPCGCEIPNSTK
jgi:hypothetical protein